MHHWLLDKIGKLSSVNKLSILIYHQVVEVTDPMRSSEPDAKTFRWQMRLLREHFNPLSLDDAVKRLQQGNLPANSVCVTFDDGYLNNLTVAQPILEEFDIPATVYIATGFCDGQNMWNDRLIDLFAKQGLSKVNLDALEMESVALSDWDNRRQQAYGLIPKIKYRDFRERQSILDQMYADNSVGEAERRMMTPEEIVKLADCGVDIGAHTESHPILNVQNLEEQRQQIDASKQYLENLLSKKVTGFAYPNGKPGSDYSPETVKVVESLGFEHAVSTNWGISSKATSTRELNRFTPWDVTAFRFHLRLIKNMLQ